MFFLFACHEQSVFYFKLFTYGFVRHQQTALVGHELACLPADLLLLEG